MKMNKMAKDNYTPRLRGYQETSRSDEEPSTEIPTRTFPEFSHREFPNIEKPEFPKIVKTKFPKLAKK